MEPHRTKSAKSGTLTLANRMSIKAVRAPYYLCRWHFIVQKYVLRLNFQGDSAIEILPGTRERTRSARHCRLPWWQNWIGLVARLLMCPIFLPTHSSGYESWRPGRVVTISM